MAHFRWTETSERAASLIVQGELTLTQIGERVGVDRRTLYEWRNDPVFRARVDEETERFRSEIRRVGIATMERRLQALNDRWMGMEQIIAARAEDPEMRAIPGGSTGLLVKSVKGLGRGKDFQVVSTYAVDVGLLRELRECMKQAAQELGQWVEKKEEAPPNQKPNPEAARRAIMASQDKDS